MPGINIDLSGLTAQLAKTKGVNASVKAFIQKILGDTAKAVADALAADDAADQGSIDAANAAIAAVTAEYAGESDALASAIVTNPGPPTP
jgi:hypothetical protein